MNRLRALSCRYKLQLRKDVMGERVSVGGFRLIMQRDAVTRYRPYLSPVIMVAIATADKLLISARITLQAYHFVIPSSAHLPEKLVPNSLTSASSASLLRYLLFINLAAPCPRSVRIMASL